eukprot:gene6990-9552_t
MSKATYSGLVVSTSESKDGNVKELELIPKAFNDSYDENSDVLPILSFKNIEVVSTSTARKIWTLGQELLLSKPRDGQAIPGSKILKGISGQINGGLVGIMGESGCGKTTLLNVLARRVDPLRMIAIGDSVFNGKPYQESQLKDFAGYVMQDDLFNPLFTVEETLYYTAALRLSGVLNAEERAVRIEDILKLLDFEHTRDVVVGDSRIKGISGGERKRLAVAVELLTKPRFLFLDEPTTGLDSTTAFHLVSVLRDLTQRKECTVVTTIHQPPTRIFNLIDHLILLRNGESVFQGTRDEAIRFFTHQNFEFPINDNPADVIVSIISSKTHDQTTGEDIPPSFDLQKPVPVNLTLGSNLPEIKPRVRTPWIQQFGFLIQRGFLDQWRRKERFIIGLVASIIMAVYLGEGVWKDIGTDQTSIGKRRPALYFVVVLQGVICNFLAAVTFPQDRALMLRERHAGTYRVSAYYLAKSSVEAIAETPQILLYSIITYYLIGFQDVPRKFMTYAFFMFLTNLAATSLTNALCALFVSIELSTVIIAFSFEIMRMYGGWFLSPIQIRDYSQFDFFSATSYIKYGFFGVANNEYDGLKLHCLTSQLKSGKCPVTTGEQQLALYGYDIFPISTCIGVLIAMIVIYKFITYAGLKLIKY